MNTDTAVNDRVNRGPKWSNIFCSLEGRIIGTRIVALTDTGSQKNFIDSP